MALNFSTLVYLPCFDTFARDIYVTPVVSNPSGVEYWSRGILDTRGTTIQTDVGFVVMSDQETILDIREVEFTGNGYAVPVQGDLIRVPQDSESGITDGIGTYEVTDAAWNGGGEITLTIRKYEPPSRTMTIGFQERT